ncbi:Murein DD-endopeptidase MepM and murein hydrolase activator NlpD, contain LysM domain [Geodermatophilus amargosae]|uniref:Murein DD-endopeptidase MepM and murein hydrolase activator NlpD, contain LysM domain n=1 Tax=Geodermatophilus amargosae TaxID=1296565 RepID=A0A1I6ZEW3_9ACTN|nr:M23 family metallopeptidase [Geodermatophilus amargosae]SFT61207.1 Murein DD-endopeptidase MepM and murein hydrolase activator NlpD, contain LysM domain [Geodermatophilus amargosae]
MPQCRPARTGRRRGVRAALAGLLTGAVLLGTAGPALAVPEPPPNPSDGQIADAQAAQEAAAAEVGRLAAEVAAAEIELERLGLQAEAAGTAFLAAEEALALAQAAADQAAADLQAAADAVDAALGRIAGFARESYVDGAGLSTAAALLDSAGPGELIQRAALLEYVADTQVELLEELEVARVRQANAESSARVTRDAAAAAEDEAAAAKAAADAQVAAQEDAVVAAEANKASLDQQLQAAQIQLLELQGARDAYQQWQEQKAAEEAAAAAAAARAAEEAAAAAAAAAAAREAARAAASSGSGGSGSASAASGGSGYVKPTSGRTSSCFGNRWGLLHAGVDIAAPIGTPIYAATSGVVQRTGPATGFGTAVYIRGDDGAITVYGHVNAEYVEKGERVTAGELIAEVGNRGQSTGPHLHFEVHPGGVMYGGQVDPVPWLRARGVAISGC